MSFVSSGDGRVTKERLKELIALGSEYDDLDFKRHWDFSDGHTHKMAMVKIFAAMSSCYNGGYVLVGIDDDGQIVGLDTAIESKVFDPANLNNLISKFIDVRIAAAVHTLDGKRVAIIYVNAAPFGLSVINANSPDDGKTFKIGDIFVRKNTASQKISQIDYNEIVRKQILEAQMEVKSNEPVGFDKDSIRSSIWSALNNLLEAKEQIERYPALDTLAYALSSSILSSKEDFEMVLDIISNWYRDHFSEDRLSINDSHIALEIALLMESAGAFALRNGNLLFAKMIAVVSVPIDEYYSYGSWIRHAQVMASRNDIPLSGENPDGGSLIASTLGTIKRFSNLRPDAQTEDAYTREVLRIEDSVLRFDFLWNVLVEFKGLNGSGFPSFMFYDSLRLQSIIQLILDEAELLFGEKSDSAKQYVSNVLAYASNANWASRGWNSFSSLRLKKIFDLPDSNAY